MSKLIIGCGYLGGHVARRWRSEGHTVTAVTRSRQRAEQFEREGLRPIVADITRPETLVGLPSAETALFAVGYDRRSGRSRRDVCVEGLRAVLGALPPQTGRIITISSTGVYGQTDGRWVDEDSPCRPLREAGKVLLAAEQLLADHALGDRGVVLRLAGIYGPGRLLRKADLLAGNPIPAPKNRYLNLIHVDDATAAVLAAAERARPPRTYLVSDGHPVDRRACFTRLAELLSAPPPRFFEPTPDALAAHHAGSNKRVSNARLLSELGVRLSYPTCGEGFAAAVKADS